MTFGFQIDIDSASSFPVLEFYPAAAILDCNEQFLKLPQCFHLYSLIVLSFKESFRYFYFMISKSSAAELLYVGKDYYVYHLHFHNVGFTT